MSNLFCHMQTTKARSAFKSVQSDPPLLPYFAVYNTHSTITHRQFLEQKFEEKLFVSILTNFQFSVISCTMLAFWYFGAVISYTCLSIIRIPLGIQLLSQNIILELIGTAGTRPSITFFSWYSFFVPCAYVFSVKIISMNTYLYFMKVD